MVSATSNIIKRELKRIKERKTLYLLSIFIPAIIFSIYALIYQNEIVRELPVAVFDEDHSSISQKIIEMVESTSSMKIAKYDYSVEEIKNDFINGKIHAAFYIPKNFEKDIKEGKGSTVVIYKNTSNLIIGNMILKDGSTIVRTVSAGVLLKKIRSKGNTYSKAMNVVNPIKIDTSLLYNPNFSYETYLVPGMIGFTFQLLIMIASVLVFSSEFSHNTFKELIEISEKSVWAMIIGKSIPHFLIHLSTSLLIIGIIMPVFNIKIAGSVIALIFIFALFVYASLSMALAVSSIIHDQQFATEIAVFYNTPAFIFSGYTFPTYAMPLIHSYISQAMPFTHFLNAFLKIAQMNTPLFYLQNEILSLLSFIIVSLIVIYFVLSYNIKRYDLLTSGVK